MVIYGEATWLSYNLKVVYEDISMVTITQPYVPGYLAFREVPFLVEKLNKLKAAEEDH